MVTSAPRSAASLILVRGGPDGLEVVLGRRRAAAAAFPGAVVFPGGKVEPDDRQAEIQAGVPAGLAPAAPGAAFAALRETFEETGLWLAADDTAASLFPHRPALARLTPFAHWITPARYPFRFDTWFFVADVNVEEARAQLSGDEFEALGWASPAAVLSDPTSLLLPPTRHSLERLAHWRTVDAVLDDAHASGPFQAVDVEARWNLAPPHSTP